MAHFVTKLLETFTKSLGVGDNYEDVALVFIVVGLMSMEVVLDLIYTVSFMDADLESI